MPGEVTFVPSVDDHVAGQRLWVRSYRRRPKFLITVAILSVMAIAEAIILATAIMNGQTWTAVLADTGPLLAAIIAFAGLQLYGWWAIPRAVRRMVAQQPSLIAETVWRWDDEGALIESPAGSSVVRWSELHRWIGDCRSTVLLPQERLLLVLPRRVLTQADAMDLDATLDRFAPLSRRS